MLFIITKRLLTYIAWAIGIMVVLVLAILWQYLWGTGVRFVIEFDNIENFSPPVAHDVHTLEGVYANALGVGVQRYGEAIPVATLPVDPNDTDNLSLLNSGFCPAFIDERMHKTGTTHQEACLTMASLDNIFIGSEGHRPPPSMADMWYAHGLAAPCCEGLIRNTPCGFEGLAWLLPQGTKQVRERFLVMSCEIWHLETAPAFKVSAHELGHVLNLHHCEYVTDSPMNASFVIDGDSLDHLTTHPSDEVRPGALGKSWCDLSNAHKTNMHPVTDPCCDQPAFTTSDDLPPGVTLTILPEKAVYLPGEPVRLRARLRIDATDGALERLVPGLHPYLGYLRVWMGDEGGTPQVLYPPLVATTSLSWEEVHQPIEESVIIDLWAMQPTHRQQLAVGATYSGLRLSRDPDAPPLRAAAVPMPVGYAPTATDVSAQGRFTSEEARRFFFMLGGDHLERGISDLEEVTRSGSPLAPYADLALGVNLATPFHRLDTPTGTIVIRPPSYQRAREYLDRAQAGRAVLPFSYQIVLDQVLGRTYEGLGDATVSAGDPNAARALYDIADSHYEAVASLVTAWVETAEGRVAVPLAMVEKAAVDLSRVRRDALRDRLHP